MFSLWWQEKWVRGLVFALSPIGLVDAIYTILLFQAHGAEYEYNLIVRLALSSNWWFIWVIIDVLSFVIFAMITGSYYLHTRLSVFGNYTSWLSALIGIRVGAVVYNILLFYGDAIPMIWASLSALAVFSVVGNLLSRNRNPSVQGFKTFWRAKYDRIHHRILLRGLERERDEDIEVPVEPSSDQTSSPVYPRRIWLERAGYISIAIIVFASIPFILVTVGMVTGGLFWSDIYGSSFYWNELSAQTFIIGFTVIIILMSVIMYMILKAFTASDGAW